VLLCGAAADRLSLVSPLDPSPYHQSVRKAAEQTPLNFGAWSGTDLPVPMEAKQQLHPNVIISRRYTNSLTQQRVALLLVQCSDVRDLTPHFPPMCYPGRGLTLISTQPRDWPLYQLTINGTEYQFESNSFKSDKLTIVDNFMILPNGRTCRDMIEVRRQIGLKTRYFGAAQVQLVFDSDTSQAERDSICTEFFKAYRPFIETVRSGFRE
jgi:hypothetical protein